MNEKMEIIARLRDVFDRWQQLLAGMSEEQITAPLAPSTWSTQDVIAHLWAWQQLSIARLEAALLNREPEFSLWPGEMEPEAEEEVDRINAWVYEANCARPWPSVYRDWQEGFLRFLELAETVPEEDLMDPERYPWLGGYPLHAVLVGSCEHHLEDHLEPLLAAGR